MEKFWTCSPNKEKLQLLVRKIAVSSLQNLTLSSMVVNDEIIPSLHKSDQQLSSIEELNCWEEEADSRVIIHIQWSISIGAKRVIVLSNDSDTLMLLFRYISQFLSKGLIDLWRQYGTSERRRMIPVHMWYTHLGEEWC